MNNNIMTAFAVIINTLVAVVALFTTSSSEVLGQMNDIRSCIYRNNCFDNSQGNEEKLEFGRNTMSLVKLMEGENKLLIHIQNAKVTTMSFPNGRKRKEVVDQITKWLNEGGYTIKQEYNAESYYQAVVIRKNITTAAPIIIRIPKESPYKIHVGITFDYKLLENVSQNRDFNYPTKIENVLHQAILPLNVSFQTDSTEEEEDTMKLKIYNVIHFDGLSKDILFGRIKNVLAAYQAADSKYQQLKKKS
jgi:hypothetical protein